MNKLHLFIRRLKSDRAAIYLEYSLLLGMLVLALLPLTPGGIIYWWIRNDIIMRLVLITLPIF